MTKGLIAVCLLTVFAVPAAAQQRQFGGKIGPTFPTIDIEEGAEDSPYEGRFAVAIGGFYVRHFNQRVAMQLELLWHPKGAELAADASEQTPALKLKLEYVDIPLLARFTLVRSADRAFYVFAGPAIAFRTAAKVESSSDVGGFNIGDSIDVGADFKKTDVAIMAGAGADIGRWLVIDGRYSWGLQDVNGSDLVMTSIHNRAFTFLAGVRF
jgi:hypothetical protein